MSMSMSTRRNKNSTRPAASGRGLDKNTTIALVNGLEGKDYGNTVSQLNRMRMSNPPRPVK